MQVETALFFETVEQIYERVFRTVKPRTPLPRITVEFRKYADANSRARLEAGHLRIHISDLLKTAPAPIQEALAYILVSKLFRRTPERGVLARYRRYLSRADVRQRIHSTKQQRGRKQYSQPAGKVYNLCAIFEELNFKYFHGLMSRPDLGWSLRPSRTTLGHYDPCHNLIVLTRLFDNETVPELIVKFVMFHEMLHLRFPTEHKNGRRCVHTTEFKRAEREFEHYEDAKLQLKKFVEQISRSG